MWATGDDTNEIAPCETAKRRNPMWPTPRTCGYDGRGKKKTFRQIQELRELQLGDVCFVVHMYIYIYTWEEGFIWDTKPQKCKWAIEKRHTHLPKQLGSVLGCCSSHQRLQLLTLFEANVLQMKGRNLFLPFILKGHSSYAKCWVPSYFAGEQFILPCALRSMQLSIYDQSMGFAQLCKLPESSPAHHISSNADVDKRNHMNTGINHLHPQ